MEDDMRPHITVVGSSNIDFIMVVPHLPGPGETVTDGAFTQTFGGKGANQAVAAARAGGDVTFVTCLGNDLSAPVFRQHLIDDGIAPEHVSHDASQPSGAALIMIGASGENCIAVSPGSNNSVTPERVHAAEREVASSGMVVLQMEIPVESIVRAMDLANKHGVPVLLNYAPVRGRPLQIDSRVSVLVVNEHEAAELCGMQQVTSDNAPVAAMHLRKLGAGAVLVTLGAQGVYVSTPDGDMHVGAFPVRAVDTTAAGDTFCGVLAVARVEGLSWSDAVRRASAAGAIAVSRQGAQPSIPTRGEIDLFLAGQS